MKIVKSSLIMNVDEELTDMSVEEIAEGSSTSDRLAFKPERTVELPENSPRYVVLSHELVRYLRLHIRLSSQKSRIIRTGGYHIP